VIKYTLRESLSTSIRSEICGETEGLVDRKVSLNNEHGSTRSLSFFENVPSPSVQDTIDTSNGILGTLNDITINNVGEIPV